MNTDAERLARLLDMLSTWSKNPDSSMVTILLGDLRMLMKGRG